MILLPEPLQNLCWNQVLRNVGLLPRVNTSWCREQRDPSDISHFQLSDVQVLWSWHHCLCTWALLSIIRGLTVAAEPTVDAEFVKPTSGSFFLETGSTKLKNIQLCCYLCCSSSVISRNSLCRCLSLNIDFCQISLFPSCCLPMIRVCRHNLRNCRSRQT